MPRLQKTESAAALSLSKASLIAIILALTGCASSNNNQQAEPAPAASPIGTSTDAAANDYRRAAVREIRVSHDAKYGYSAEQPIMLGGLSQLALRQQAYLSSLRGPNGELVFYQRIGSCCGFETENSRFGSGVLDQYKLRIEGQSSSVVLYFNGYEQSSELYIPAGFSQKTGARDPQQARTLLDIEPEVSRLTAEQLVPDLLRYCNVPSKQREARLSEVSARDSSAETARMPLPPSHRIVNSWMVGEKPRDYRLSIHANGKCSISDVGIEQGIAAFVAVALQQAGVRIDSDTTRPTAKGISETNTRKTPDGFPVTITNDSRHLLLAPNDRVLLITRVSGELTSAVTLSILPPSR